MRLLNANSLSLESFNDTKLPLYAVASHRWAATDEEVSLQDVQNGNGSEKAGYRKIEGFCAFLRERNYEIKNGSPQRNRVDYLRSSQGYMHVVEWLWIDTCCIDQTSSTEVQEAITSMWRWYRQAYVCLAYLNDVRIRADFPNSVWFTRGWTLQELLAPRTVIFLNSEWDMFGHKCPHTQCPLQPCGSPQLNAEVLNPELEQITRVPRTILKSSLALSSCPVAERVKWMRNRTTKKIEDLAYSLLGICEIFMPLMYGEGENAWIRLEDEVSRRHQQRIQLERPLRLADDGTRNNSPGAVPYCGNGRNWQWKEHAHIYDHRRGCGDWTWTSFMYVQFPGTGANVSLHWSVRLIPSILPGTSEVQSFSFEYDGRLIYLVDIPAFDQSTRTDVEVLNDVASWLRSMFREQIKLSGIIYLHPITNKYMTNSMSKYLRVFKKLWGEECFSSVVIATTMWDRVNHEDGSRREHQLVATVEFWGDLVAQGARVVRYDDSYDSAMQLIHYVLDLYRTPVLQFQREAVEEDKPIDQTSAGRELQKDLIEQREQFERQLELLRRELEAQLAYERRQMEVDADDKRRKIKDDEALLQKELDKQTKLLQDVIKSEVHRLEEAIDLPLLNRLKFGLDQGYGS